MDTSESQNTNSQQDADQQKAAWDQLNLVLGFFSRIDTKLSVVLGVDLGMLALLPARIADVSKVTVWQALFILVFVGFLTKSLYHLYKGSFPHLEGGTNSLVYFRAISNMREQEFVTAYQARHRSEHTKDVLEQAWRNSKILAGKFDSLSKGYNALLCALVPWVISLALLTVK